MAAYISHQHFVLCLGKLFQTAEEIESMQWVMLLPASLLLLSLGAEAAVPALFVFGDSLVDDGNNNALASALVKANYFPYGLDFLGGAPTGRFCNGKTVIDALCTSWLAF
jgi:hypothetical protein